MDWLDLLAVRGTLKSLLQQHSLKASIIWYSAFFIVQLLQLLFHFLWNVNKITFHCVRVQNLLYPFILWTFRFFPYLGYCELSCNEHWGACMFSDVGFLQIYVQWFIIICQLSICVGKAEGNAMYIYDRYYFCFSFWILGIFPIITAIFSY